MAERKDIVRVLDDLLRPHLFKDYCPNGLQVEGCTEINKIVSGVTACQALIDQAIEQQADCILVHHGIFWKGDSSVISGLKKNRIKALLDNDINLLAYHLPIDAHDRMGNNVQLAARLGIEIIGPMAGTGSPEIAMVGQLAEPLPIKVFGRRVEEALGRVPQLIECGDHQIKNIAWCTGAAQGYIEQACDYGVDAYLSGEISEPTVHVARENGVHYIAAGHHATERYGVQAVAEYLALTFGLEHQFIDIDNPA
ncbi:MAG: Nif3-like dinuclear metal center hexameric protein [Gammaproteobacteria bacterium]|nr:MAG: Nif3-like dinuclear metal center hexameric protein [Gammaproteobacteria bacterium]